MAFEEIKKQRFRFLQKLYEISGCDVHQRFNKHNIGKMLDIEANLTETISEYLTREGLIDDVDWMTTRGMMFDRDQGINITHNGIKEIEQAQDHPETPTQHFPANIYYISGNYVERDRTMGDVFSGISNATIINRSLVQDSFNKVKKDYDEETSKALIKVAEFIEKSGDPAAGVLFDNFNQELNKPQPEKSKLKKIWEGIVKILPSIASIAGAIAPLFI